MLSPGMKVVLDPENAQSVRLDGADAVAVRARGAAYAVDKALDGRTLVCQANGDQETGVERAEDTAIIVDALNAHLNPQFSREEKVQVLGRVLRNAGGAAPFKLTHSEQPSSKTIENDGRWMFGCLGLENPTNEELRKLGFIK